MIDKSERLQDRTGRAEYFLVSYVRVTRELARSVYYPQMTSTRTFTRYLATAATISAACALSAATGGVATAQPNTALDLPNWYTSNKITTENCGSPLKIDDDTVQVRCHTQAFKWVLASTPATGEDGSRLQVEVSVPIKAGEYHDVDVHTYDDRDIARVAPRQMDTVVSGETKTFQFNRHDTEWGGHRAGTTLVVQSPFPAHSDVTLTFVRPPV